MPSDPELLEDYNQRLLALVEALKGLPTRYALIQQLHEAERKVEELQREARVLEKLEARFTAESEGARDYFNRDTAYEVLDRIDEIRQEVEREG